MKLPERNRDYWKNVGLYYLVVIVLLLAGYIFEGKDGVLYPLLMLGSGCIVIVGHHIGMYFAGPKNKHTDKPVN